MPGIADNPKIKIRYFVICYELINLSVKDIFLTLIQEDYTLSSSTFKIDTNFRFLNEDGLRCAGHNLDLE